MSNLPLYVGEELVFGLHFCHQNFSFKPIFVLFLESLREQACTREPVIPRFDKLFEELCSPHDTIWCPMKGGEGKQGNGLS